MKRTYTGWRRVFGTLSFLSFQILALSPCPAGTTLQVEPESIRIGTFYADTQVEVSAEIPDGCDAVVEVLGSDIEEQLLRKGRRWDIWMDVGEIDIEGAPCLYFAMSSDPESLNPAAPDPDFGYGVLEQRASFLGDVRGLKSTKIFDEFVKLKESERLYRVDPGKLNLSQSPGGSTVARGTFTIPSRIAPGTYQVRLSVLRNGRLLETRTAALTVQVVSLPALLSGLARRHGGLYGLLAVAVAVVFGYVTGAVFQRAQPRRRESTGGGATADRNDGS